MSVHAFPNRRRTTEYFGQGQSGYMAGRVEGDCSLQLEARNAAYPQGADEEHALGLATDERFTGLGRAPWAPEGPCGPGAREDT
jgi:hypothetical protein